MSIARVSNVNVNQTNFGKNNYQIEKSSPYENPISRNAEKNLAILNSVGGSAIIGAVAGGLTSCFVAAGTKGNFFSKNKTSILAGLGAMAVSLLITLPSKLYSTKVNAFVKEKEMDVFARDRALKSNLTEEVHSEVLDPRISLDKKLDDNLKLQMANRGNALGVANI